jgi:hypothetical protein
VLRSKKQLWNVAPGWFIYSGTAGWGYHLDVLCGYEHLKMKGEVYCLCCFRP